MLPQLTFRESAKVRRQGAPAATLCVPRGLLGLATQVGVHLASNQDAEVVKMPVAAPDLRPHPVLTTLGSVATTVTSSWCRTATGWSA